MNKLRRKNLKQVLSKMDTLTALVEEVKEDLQAVMDEEEEARENLPESLQDGERGEQMQEYIDTLEEAIFSLGELDTQDLYEKIEEIVQG